MSKNFAFLVHPRDRMDYCRGFWPGYLLPNAGLKYIGKKMKKRLLSHISYEELEGYLVAVSLLPEQILSKPRFAQQCALEASCKAIEEFEVGVIGLGALLAPVTFGGTWLDKQLKKLYPNREIIVTSGNSLTAAMTAEGVQEAAAIRGLNLHDGTHQIAVLGATGSVGSGVCQLLIESLTKPNFLLISRTERKLEALKENLSTLNPSALIDFSIEAEDAKSADIIIVLTSGAEAILSANDLRQCVIVYDVTQPSQISQEILENRSDILVIDGGLVTTPGLDWGFDMGLPRDTSFGCLAETMFLAQNGGRFQGLDFTGSVNVETARRMAKEAREYGFTHAPLTSFRRPVLKQAKGGVYFVKEKYLDKMNLLL